VRVIDFSWLLPGPFCTRVLADLGADVIKIEPPGGDYITRMMPGAHEVLNRAKSVWSVDLKADEGLDLVLDLCASAQVVVEGFRPGVTDRLGIGFDDVCSRSPEVVYCSISGFGQTGARRDEPGHDVAYQAIAGAFAAVLALDEPPTRSTLPIADLGSGLLAATSICAALADRSRAGAVHLDLSMAESVAYMAASSRWGSYPAAGRPVEVTDLASYAPGNGLYRTRDGRWVALAAVEDKYWERLCLALGRPELAATRFATHEARMEHREELAAEIEREISDRTLSDLAKVLEGAEVPVTPLRRAGEVCGDAALQERGAVEPQGHGWVVHHPVTAREGRITAPSGDPSRSPVGALAEAGIAQDRVDRLSAAGILQPGRAHEVHDVVAQGDTSDG
jgi:crotonobetainyl-CoA:carnitine CoA-transferase CaiB-like acyl-CoA transferase